MIYAFARGTGRGSRTSISASNFCAKTACQQWRRPTTRGSGAMARSYLDAKSFPLLADQLVSDLCAGSYEEQTTYVRFLPDDLLRDMSGQHSIDRALKTRSSTRIPLIFSVEAGHSVKISCFSGGHGAGTRLLVISAQGDVPLQHMCQPERSLWRGSSGWYRYRVSLRVPIKSVLAQHSDSRTLRTCPVLLLLLLRGGHGDGFRVG